MSIEGHLLKVSAAASDLTVKPGQELLVPVKVAPVRPPGRARQARSWSVPEDLQGLLRMDPVIVPLGRAEATLRITTVAEPRLTGEQTLTIRATALQRGNLRVMSEAAVPFVAVGR